MNGDVNDVKIQCVGVFSKKYGLSIFEYAPRDRGARVMAELAEELELRGHPQEGAVTP